MTGEARICQQNSNNFHDCFYIFEETIKQELTDISYQNKN